MWPFFTFHVGKSSICGASGNAWFIVFFSNDLILFASLHTRVPGFVSCSPMGFLCVFLFVQVIILRGFSDVFSILFSIFWEFPPPKKNKISTSKVFVDINEKKTSTWWSFSAQDFFPRREWLERNGLDRGWSRLTGSVGSGQSSKAFLGDRAERKYERYTQRYPEYIYILYTWIFQGVLNG